MSKKPPTSSAEASSMPVKNYPKFKEPYRSHYHFTPPEKWMNDPNGLVFYNNTYHLFYQYYPGDIVWGPMHWGHATSKDLISWKHQPIALYPDEHGLIFSGSAVMDLKNTSGFGQPEKPAMVAIFTYHLMAGEKASRNDYQTQGIAYSLDEGQTWTKYDGNPIISNSGIKDFRDPKVFWHEPSQKWIMVLVAGDHAKIYNSANLKEWTHLSDFGKHQGAHGGVWECPDLFPLQVAGTNQTNWVLLVSINPGAPNGGSGTQYFVGDFDGNTFTSNQKETLWIDYGTDNYAGVTYNGLSNDQRTFIGWMSNWNYARDTPTEVWRSAMTLPRKLTLHKNKNEYYVKNYPIASAKSYEGNPIVLPAIPGGNSIAADALQQSRIQFEITDGTKDFSIAFSNDQGEIYSLNYNASKGLIYTDRSKSGQIDFEASFGKGTHEAPLMADVHQPLTVTIHLDASSIESFINEGATVLTDQVFPNVPYNQIQFNGEGVNFKNIEIANIASIW